MSRRFERARKNPLGAGWVVAQIAPFSVPVKYLRSYVNQVGVVGGWLDLYPLAKMGLVPFVCQNRSPTCPGLGTGMASGCALRFLFTL